MVLQCYGVIVLQFYRTITPAHCNTVKQKRSRT